jgi:hypothetical protein
VVKEGEKGRKEGKKEVEIEVKKEENVDVVKVLKKEVKAVDVGRKRDVKGG